MITEHLHFIAIIPPSPLKEKVSLIKKDFANKYGAIHALKSPPHITLIPPFKMNKSIELKVSDFLHDFVVNVKPFYITLEGYDHFKPHVIFLKPLINSEIKDLHRNLTNQFYQIFPSGKPSKRRFHPHMTIAFRDLTPKMFYAAWEYYKKAEFNTEFLVDQICLLKHNGKIWEEHKEYHFTK